MSAADRRQRRYWQLVVRDLELPAPFDLELFCTQIGRQSGRTLVLVPRDSRRSGYWARNPAARRASRRIKVITSGY